MKGNKKKRKKKRKEKGWTYPYSLKKTIIILI